MRRKGLAGVVGDQKRGPERISWSCLYRKPNPCSVRLRSDRLEELADSIKEHGVVQAVIVSPAPRGGYYLVAGERRCRAAKNGGADEGASTGQGAR